jgi:HSP20 family protein
MRGSQNLFRGFPVNRLRQEMDRMVSEVFAPVASEVNTWFQPGVGAAPRLNVWEENDTFFAEAEVPGLKHEDLDVSVIGNQLTIKGRREAAAEKETMFHRRERSTGEFVRAVTLPAEVDADKVSATLTNGVLTVTLPKAEAAKPRKINIQD